MILVWLQENRTDFGMCNVNPINNFETSYNTAKNQQTSLYIRIDFLLLYYIGFPVTQYRNWQKYCFYNGPFQHLLNL